jgi:hypothetical protein
MENMPPIPGVGGTAARAGKRRSERIKLKIPLTIHVGSIVLRAETVMVSKHGAKIRILSVSERLACGERMRLVMRKARQPQTARVVWLDKTAEPHCGIELDDPNNFWGVHFPATADDDRPAQTTPRPAEPHAAPQASERRANPPSELRITPRSAPTVEQGDRADARTMPAVLTGMSAVRSPLTENVDIVFTRPDEATALLEDQVEPGTSVRLMFSKDRQILGRVAAIGAQKQAGKWRIRIKCDTPCF